MGAKILCDHFALFTDLSDNVGGEPVIVEKAGDDQSKQLQMTIEELDLSVRSFNCLKRANINTVEGRKSLEEVINKLAMMGLHLAGEENN